MDSFKNIAINLITFYTYITINIMGNSSKSKTSQKEISE